MEAESINWPAWVQAVGTLIAVGVAIWVPHRDRQAELRRFEDGALAVADTAVALGREMSEFTRDDSVLAGVVLFGWDGDRVTDLEAALAEVSLSRLPSVHAIAHFLDVKRLLNQGRLETDRAIAAHETKANNWTACQHDLQRTISDLEEARDNFRKEVMRHRRPWLFRLFFRSPAQA